MWLTEQPNGNWTHQLKNTGNCFLDSCASGNIKHSSSGPGEGQWLAGPGSPRQLQSGYCPEKELPQADSPRWHSPAGAVRKAILQTPVPQSIPSVSYTHLDVYKRQILRKLCERGIFQNNGGIVSSVLSKNDFYACLLYTSMYQVYFHEFL